MFSVNLVIGVSLSTIFLMMFSGCFLPYFSNAFAFTDINFAPPLVTSIVQEVAHQTNGRPCIILSQGMRKEFFSWVDYSYRTVGNVDCWAKFLDDSTLDLTRVKQTVGNHETDQSGKLTDFVNTFKPYPPAQHNNTIHSIIKGRPATQKSMF